MDTREGPHTSKCTRSKRAREDEILLLRGNAENYVSLQPLQSEISWLPKIPKTLVDAKNFKRDAETWPKRECHK